MPEISYKAFGFRQIPQMNIVGSNFAIAKQVAAVAPSETAPQTSKAAIPIKSTHVVIMPADLFAEAGGGGATLRQLKPGAQVTLVRTQQGWTLVAKDGRMLGYLAESALAPMH